MSNICKFHIFEQRGIWIDIFPKIFKYYYDRYSGTLDKDETASLVRNSGLSILLRYFKIYRSTFSIIC
jgi:hypothetical protein